MLEDVDVVVQVVVDVFFVWVVLLLGECCKCLFKVVELMDQYIDVFICVGVVEIGVSFNWIGFNVMLVVNMLCEVVFMIMQIDGSVIFLDVLGNFVMVVCQLCGVVFGIVLWNVLVILGMCVLVMLLVCGNIVVFKVLELCLGVYWLIGIVLQEVGLGDGVVNVVINVLVDVVQVVECLIVYLVVCCVNFMGLMYVGCIIVQYVVWYLKFVLLELGGKVLVLVLDDVDLDVVVDVIVFGVFFNQGQICMLIECVIVDCKIVEVFVDKLVVKVCMFCVGDLIDVIV